MREFYKYKPQLPLVKSKSVLFLTCFVDFYRSEMGVLKSVTDFQASVAHT